jgi:hypothetical protein
MMIYGESKNASSVFRKNMNYFFFNVPTISSGGNPGNPGGDDPGDGGLPPDDVNDENIPQDENIIIPHIENPYIDTNEPDANIDINYLPEIFLGDGQGIKITKNGLCVVGAKVVVTAPDGTKKEYVLTDTCELEFIPDQEGDYIIEITLPDGTKIIKQFKVKPKGKAGIFDDTESLIACIVLGGLGVFLVGFVTYRYFFPKKLGGLKNV